MDTLGHLKLTATLNAPRLWTAETPKLYRVRLSLTRGGKVIHVLTQRFGFRTFELRAGQGAFLNGRRVRFKGIGLHSFRPVTARALDDAENYADVRLIKQAADRLHRRHPAHSRRSGHDGGVGPGRAISEDGARPETPRLFECYISARVPAAL